MNKLQNSNNYWIPYGKEVVIRHHKISLGLIYVGTDLKSINNNLIEPALINPKLVTNYIDIEKIRNSYASWDSYNNIRPAARKIYIEWLSSNRDDSKAPIGCLFLYFYGLERRLLHDIKDAENCDMKEVKIIIKEVERLLKVYSTNRIFREKVIDFLNIVKIKFELYKHQENTSLDVNSIEFKYKLSKMIENKLPIDNNIAIKLGKKFTENHFYTDFTFEKKEFKLLFELRFNKAFKSGFILKCRNSCLDLIYKPASSSFSDYINFIIPDFYDVNLDNSNIYEIIKIFDDCFNDIRQFSNYNPTIYYSPSYLNNNVNYDIAKYSLLPKEIIRLVSIPSLKSIIDWLDTYITENYKIINFNEILDVLLLNNGKSLNQQNISYITTLLSKLDYGFEPDVRFSSNKVDYNTEIVLFKLMDDSPNAPTQEYIATTLILHLAVLVGIADGQYVEAEHNTILSHLESIFGLSTQEKQRLEMFVRWLSISDLKLNGIKKRLESLNQEQKMSISKFLVSVACADGIIHPKEVEVLKKIYKLLELDPESIYSNIHNNQTIINNEPKTIIAGETSLNYKIPKKTDKIDENTLNQHIINSKIKESLEVRAILSQIFVETDTEPVKVKQIHLTWKGLIMTIVYY